MLAFLTAGIAPALALMAFFYLKDQFAEPLILMCKTFLLGALLVFPIMFIQYGLTVENLAENSIVQSFIQSALIEEFFKWFIFIYVVFHHTEFDSHYDGIVYAVAISLGFAAVENILYLMINGLEFAVIRALFPVSSHALFAVIAGYHLGKAKMNRRHKRWNLLLAFMLPFLLHGTYNFILATVTSDWLILLIPFMIGLWWTALHRMKKANKYVLYHKEIEA